MLPKAILFDMDDTIILSGGISDEIWDEISRHFVSKYNLFEYHVFTNELLRLRKWFWSDKKRHKAGRQDMLLARRDLIKMTIESLGGKDHGYADEMAKLFVKRHMESMKMFDKAEDTLVELGKSGVKLALVTNGGVVEQRGKIEKFQLEKYFDTILVEGETGFGKPEPEVYLMALERLGVKAEETWMVGDNLEWDVEGPQKLGIYGIWNDYRNTGLPEDSKVIPDRIVRSIGELLD
ncbi:MAG TPA: HAD family hydrolase [Pseudobacteroides sp.]|uniref:HAD family hydrolase n=1 Tax=Pseudobacteroides sp. TaxID=1968840 RepID=UPI002F93F6EF